MIFAGSLADSVRSSLCRKFSGFRPQRSAIGSSKNVLPIAHALDAGKLRLCVARTRTVGWNCMKSTHRVLGHSLTHWLRSIWERGFCLWNERVYFIQFQTTVGRCHSLYASKEFRHRIDFSFIQLIRDSGYWDYMAGSDIYIPEVTSGLISLDSVATGNLSWIVKSNEAVSLSLSIWFCHTIWKCNNLFLCVSVLKCRYRCFLVHT